MVSFHTSVCPPFSRIGQKKKQEPFKKFPAQIFHCSAVNYLVFDRLSFDSLLGFINEPYIFYAYLNLSRNQQNHHNYLTFQNYIWHKI